VPVDDVAGGLGAVDDNFRGGRMGLRAIATDLHSTHWVSDRASARALPLGPTARRRFEALNRLQRLGADTYVPALCNLPPKHSDCAPAQSRCGRCVLPPNAYARMQAIDAPVWRRVRCLFHRDFEMNERQLCAQAWLLERCRACAATCAANEKRWRWLERPDGDANEPALRGRGPEAAIAAPGDNVGALLL
jgi:hypothetical protein